MIEAQPQTQEAEYQGVGYFTAPQKVGDETIKWQLDPTDVLDEIRYYLKQWHKEDGQWKAVFKDVVPLMSDEGINNLIGILRQYLNKNNVLSNLSNEQINTIMLDVCKTLRIFLVSNYKQYQIEKKNFDLVKLTTENEIYAFLLRAKDNGERLRWMKTHQVAESKTVVEQDKPKKWGII